MSTRLEVEGKISSAAEAEGSGPTLRTVKWWTPQSTVFQLCSSG